MYFGGHVVSGHVVSGHVVNGLGWVLALLGLAWVERGTRTFGGNKDVQSFSGQR